MQRNREKECLMLDYYGELLTKHQRDILDEYFNEDLSMNEIADNLGISKSAVQDLIKRSLKQLEEYEDKLRLVEKDKKIKILLDDMRSSDNDLLKKYADKIEKIG